MSETTRKALDFYYTFWDRTVFALNKIELLLDKIEKMERSGSYRERNDR
jgi:hypothetical protein